MRIMREEDVRLARAQTPGCAEVVHLNNAGSALPPSVVTETMIEHLRAEALHGGYEAAAQASTRIDAVYRSAATLLGSEVDDIALTDNATRSWQAVAYALPFRPGDRILTCRAEYASNAVALLQIARRTGAAVEVVEDDETGQLDVADLRRKLDDRVRLISITHVPTQGGLVNPAEEVGAIAAEAGVPFLLDACQSAGQLDLDVRRLRCDALSVTGRKFLRGPRGTGLLYVHPSLRERVEPAMLDLHSATWTAPDRYEVATTARRFEVWERDVAAVLGLGAAIDHALHWGLPAIEHRIGMLAEDLRAGLSALPGVRVHDLGTRRCGIVTFTVTGMPAGEVKRRLAEQGINTSVSTRGSALLDFSTRDLAEVVRASVHYYNTEQETARLVETVGRICP